jgi:multidrug efflux pump subunit AcrA (membrane-fusion protein)
MIGMSVEANIVTQEATDTVLAPAAAISEDHVFVVGGGRAVPRKVTIGIRGTRHVQIRSGLQEGETIVSPALPSLRANSRISVTNPSK